MTDFIKPQDVFKYCPRCGSDNFNFNGEKSFHCKSCNFTYFVNVAGAVAALIFDEDNRLLFTKRANDPFKGTLDLPGGFIDNNETAEEALKREINEELNLEITNFAFYQSFPNTYTYKGFTYRTIDLFFRCTAGNMNLLKAGDDAADVVFIPLDKITLKDIGLTSIRQVVGSFIKENSKQ